MFGKRIKVFTLRHSHNNKSGKLVAKIFADIWHISIFADAPPPRLVGGVADYTADEQTDICPDPPHHLHHYNAIK